MEEPLTGVKCSLLVQQTQLLYVFLNLEANEKKKNKCLKTHENMNENTGALNFTFAYWQARSLPVRRLI